MVLSVFVATNTSTHLISTAAHLASHIDRPDPANGTNSQTKLQNTGNQHSGIATTLINNGTNHGTNT